MWAKRCQHFARIASSCSWLRVAPLGLFPSLALLTATAAPPSCTLPPPLAGRHRGCDREARAAKGGKRRAQRAGVHAAAGLRERCLGGLSARFSARAHLAGARAAPARPAGAKALSKPARGRARRRGAMLWEGEARSREEKSRRWPCASLFSSPSPSFSLLALFFSFVPPAPLRCGAAALRAPCGRGRPLAVPGADAASGTHRGTAWSHAVSLYFLADPSFRAGVSLAIASTSAGPLVSCGPLFSAAYERRDTMKAFPFSFCAFVVLLCLGRREDTHTHTHTRTRTHTTRQQHAPLP